MKKRASSLPLIAKCNACVRESVGVVSPGNVYTTGGRAWHEVAERIVSKQAVNVDLISAKYGIDSASIEEAIEAFDFLNDVGDGEPNTLYVFDWKTGFLEQDDPARNFQTMFYAIAAYHHALKNHVGRIAIEAPAEFAGLTGHPDLVIYPANENYTIEKVSIGIYYPRLKKFARKEFTPAELGEWEKEIRGLVDAANDKESQHTVGDHCKMCPAFGKCPAVHRQIQTLDLPGLEPPSVRLTDLPAARVGELFMAFKAAQKAVSDFEKSFKDYASAKGPIPLPDGRRFGEFEKMGHRQIDVEAAWPILTEEIPGDLADVCKITTGAMDKAVKAAVRREHDGKPPRGSLGKAVDRVWARLYESGAVSREAVTTIGIMPKEEGNNEE